MPQASPAGRLGAALCLLLSACLLAIAHAASNEPTEYGIPQSRLTQLALADAEKDAKPESGLPLPFALLALHARHLDRQRSWASHARHARDDDDDEEEEEEDDEEEEEEDKDFPLERFVDPTKPAGFAVLTRTSACPHCNGTIEFWDNGDHVAAAIDVRITVFPIGTELSLHLHTYGDLRGVFTGDENVANPRARSVGPFFRTIPLQGPDNMENELAMCNGTLEEHVGDFGHITIDSTGRAKTVLKSRTASLDPNSPNYIIGRSVVLYDRRVDCPTRPNFMTQLGRDRWERQGRENDPLGPAADSSYDDGSDALAAGWPEYAELQSPAYSDPEVERAFFEEMTVQEARSSREAARTYAGRLRVPQRGPARAHPGRIALAGVIGLENSPTVHSVPGTVEVADPPPFKVQHAVAVTSWDTAKIAHMVESMKPRTEPAPKYEKRWPSFFLDKEPSPNGIAYFDILPGSEVSPEGSAREEFLRVRMHHRNLRPKNLYAASVHTFGDIYSGGAIFAGDIFLPASLEGTLARKPTGVSSHSGESTSLLPNAPVSPTTFPFEEGEAIHAPAAGVRQRRQENREDREDREDQEDREDDDEEREMQICRFVGPFIRKPGDLGRMVSSATGTITANLTLPTTLGAPETTGIGGLTIFDRGDRSILGRAYGLRLTLKPLSPDWYYYFDEEYYYDEEYYFPEDDEEDSEEDGYDYGAIGTRPAGSGPGKRARRWAQADAHSDSHEGENPLLDRSQAEDYDYQGAEDEGAAGPAGSEATVYRYSDPWINLAEADETHPSQVIPPKSPYARWEWALPKRKPPVIVPCPRPYQPMRDHEMVVHLGVIGVRNPYWPEPVPIGEQDEDGNITYEETDLDRGTDPPGRPMPEGGPKLGTKPRDTNASDQDQALPERRPNGASGWLPAGVTLLAAMRLAMATATALLIWA
ncbi:hypothetical protein H696_06238 [Fonticula alba]|uniref:Superoxide dismutase copper/zinc binding domain-containing protein n=1 Tax=Fonticula alba TaxID=691883 RepID=A0A058YZC9_FONAL|nr:hypothetical protein H696_06238 [Fonticula alba]KCV67339.1 hypothetical protein H696_06238 [Fonticula alba]|eukprot:XP_009498261.1 hypothetical protein H696_06238 [Fonticula alba]